MEKKCQLCWPPALNLAPAQATRVKSITQLVSQVLPPSVENAYSQHGVGVSVRLQMKRTWIGRPSKPSPA